MRVPQLDLQAQHETLRGPMAAAVAALFESQRFVLGEAVSRFEAEIAALIGVPGAVGVASGSEALRVAFAVLDVGPGDEVVVPAFTFFATAGAVVHAGATPVFADVGEDFLLDPADVERVLTPRTKAIVPVHLYGLQAPWAPFAELAAAHGLALVEDAAQSVGARRPEGACGSLGDAAAFSFFPSKNLGGAGDGGLVTCADPERLERARRFRVHGERERYYHAEVGSNGRLDALQAAVLSVKLPHLPGWNAARRERAARYDALLADLAAAELIRRPGLPEGEEHVFHQYTLCARDRDALLDHLREAGIGAAVYYPVPLHRQECFAGLPAAARALPATERLAAEVVSLPIYPELTDAMQAQVAESIAAFYRG